MIPLCQAGTRGAEQAVLSAKAALAGDPTIATDSHPEVMQALAKLAKAKLDLEHTQVVAPADRPDQNAAPARPFYERAVVILKSSCDAGDSTACVRLAAVYDRATGADRAARPV